MSNQSFIDSLDVAAEDSGQEAKQSFIGPISPDLPEAQADALRIAEEAMQEGEDEEARDAIGSFLIDAFHLTTEQILGSFKNIDLISLEIIRVGKSKRWKELRGVLWNDSRLSTFARRMVAWKEGSLSESELSMTIAELNVYLEASLGFYTKLRSDAAEKSSRKRKKTRTLAAAEVVQDADALEAGKEALSDQLPPLPTSNLVSPRAEKEVELEAQEPGVQVGLGPDVVAGAQLEGMLGPEDAPPAQLEKSVVLEATEPAPLEVPIEAALEAQEPSVQVGLGPDVVAGVQLEGMLGPEVVEPAQLEKELGPEDVPLAQLEKSVVLEATEPAPLEVPIEAALEAQEPSVQVGLGPDVVAGVQLEGILGPEVVEPAQLEKELGPEDVPLAQLEKELGPEDVPLAQLEKELGPEDAPPAQLEKKLEPEDAPLAQLEKKLGPEDAPLAQLEKELGPEDVPLAQLEKELGSEDAPLAQLEKELGPEDVPLAQLEKELGSEDAPPAQLEKKLEPEVALPAQLEKELGSEDAPLAQLEKELGSEDAPPAQLEKKLGPEDAPLAQLEKELGPEDAPPAQLEKKLELTPRGGLLAPKGARKEKAFLPVAKVTSLAAAASTVVSDQELVGAYSIYLSSTQKASLRILEKALSQNRAGLAKQELHTFLWESFIATREALLFFFVEVDLLTLESIRDSKLEDWFHLRKVLWDGDKLTPFAEKFLSWYCGKLERADWSLELDELNSYLEVSMDFYASLPQLNKEPELGDDDIFNPEARLRTAAAAGARREVKLSLPSAANPLGYSDQDSDPIANAYASVKLNVKTDYLGYGNNEEGVMGYRGRLTISREDEEPVEARLQSSNPLLSLSSAILAGVKPSITYWMPSVAFPQPDGNLRIVTPEQMEVIPVASLFSSSFTDKIKHYQVFLLLLAPCLIGFAYFGFVYLVAAFKVAGQIEISFPDVYRALIRGHAGAKLSEAGIGIFQLQVVPVSNKIQMVWVLFAWLGPLVATKFFRFLSSARKLTFASVLASSLFMPTFALIILWRIQKMFLPIFSNNNFAALNLGDFIPWAVPLNVLVAGYLFTSVHGLWDRKVPSPELRVALPVVLSCLYFLVCGVLIFSSGLF